MTDANDEPEARGSGVERCAFCRIVKNEAESHVVFDDGTSLAFLDRRPVFPGHTLLVPKNHYETLTDLPHNLVAPLFSNAQMVTAAVVEAMAAEGSFVAINNRISQGVPHLHIHIVPRRRNDGLKGFFWPRNPYKSEEEILRTQEAIRSSVRRLLRLRSRETS